MAVRRVHSAAAVQGAAEDELVAKLRRGELDREGFYTALVERSVAHMVGRVSPEKLAITRERMREEAETSPILIEIIREATGGAVVPADD